MTAAAFSLSYGDNVGGRWCWFCMYVMTARAVDSVSVRVHVCAVVNCFFCVVHVSMDFDFDERICTLRWISFFFLCNIMDFYYDKM